MEINKLNKLVEQYIAPIFGIQFNIGAVPPIPEPHDVDIWRHVSTPYLLGNSDSYLFSGLSQFYLLSAINGVSIWADVIDTVVGNTIEQQRGFLLNHIQTLLEDNTSFPSPLKDLIYLYISGQATPLMDYTQPMYLMAHDGTDNTIIQEYPDGTYHNSESSSGSGYPGAYTTITDTLTTHKGFMSRFTEWEGVAVEHIVEPPFIRYVSFSGSVFDAGIGGAGLYFETSPHYYAYYIESSVFAPWGLEPKIFDEMQAVLDSSLMSFFDSNWDIYDPLVYLEPFIARPAMYWENDDSYAYITDYSFALLWLAYLQIHNITIKDANWEHRVLVQLAFDEENRIGRDNASKLNTFYTQSLGNTVIGLNRAELKKVASQYSEAASNKLEEIYQKVETLSSDKFDLLRRVFDKNPHLMLSLFNGL